VTARRCPSCGRPAEREFATAPLVCASCLLRVGLRGNAQNAGADESVLDYLRVLNVIGQGGRGRVFLAEWSTPGGGMVALKCASPDVSGRAVAPGLCALDHPSIATIHELGINERLGAYAVTDYVPGLPITRFCAREHLTAAERTELWLQAADAIAYAHACGLPHLNLKPTNVLVVARMVYVLDFRDALPVRSKVAASPCLAPEQTTDAAGDPRSDVFALGMLLAELVADQPEAALVQALAKHATRPDPAERPRSVAALAAEVRTCLHRLSPASI
jgi:serine/threonine protein kinase